MRHFETTAEIAAPPQRVWAVMSDIDRWHEWTPSITSVRRLGDAPFAVGTRVMIRQPKLPPALWRITEIEPGHSFTWISVAPGLRVTGRHTVDGSPGGSTASLGIDIDGLLGGLWGRLSRGITERYIAMEARGLAARSTDPAYRHGG